jgi:hypothetical protein
MSRVRIDIPKKCSISLIIANVAKRITIPIKALVILPLAPSSACLSPPDEIHCIAPIINIKRKTTEPTTKRIVIMAGMAFWRKLKESGLLPKEEGSTGFVIDPPCAGGFVTQQPLTQ